MLRGVAAITVLLVVGAACGSSPAAGSAPALRLIKVGERPVAPVFGFGSVWVPNSADGTVTRVDAGSGRVTATISVGDPANLLGRGCLSYGVHALYSGSFSYRACDMPSAAASGQDGVWVTDNADQAVAKLDPKRNRVEARIPVGLDLWGIAAAPGMVWATDYNSGTVVRIDPVDDTVAARVSVPPGPTGIAIGPDGVWVVCTLARVAVEIDPATNTVVRSAPVGEFANAMETVVAFGSVWVMNQRDGSLYRFDERSGAAQAVVATRARAGRNGLGGMAAWRGGLWLGGLQVQRVDPASDRVSAVLSRDGIAVTAGPDSLWAVTVAGELTRLDPAAAERV